MNFHIYRLLFFSWKQNILKHVALWTLKVKSTAFYRRHLVFFLCSLSFSQLCDDLCTYLIMVPGILLPVPYYRTFCSYLDHIIIHSYYKYRDEPFVSLAVGMKDLCDFEDFNYFAAFRDCHNLLSLMLKYQRIKMYKTTIG